MPPCSCHSRVKTSARVQVYNHRSNVHVAAFGILFWISSAFMWRLTDVGTRSNKRKINKFLFFNTCARGEEAVEHREGAAEDGWCWFKWSVHVHGIDWEDPTAAHRGDDEGLGGGLEEGPAQRRPKNKRASTQFSGLSHYCASPTYWLFCPLWCDAACLMSYFSKGGKKTKTGWSAHFASQWSARFSV